MHQTIQNATKGINSTSTTMSGMGQDLHNMEKYMEYYAAKLHQMGKLVEVSNTPPLCKHNLFTLTHLNLSKRIFMLLLMLETFFLC